jgi:hypothetical protein
VLAKGLLDSNQKISDLSARAVIDLLGRTYFEGVVNFSVTSKERMAAKIPWGELLKIAPQVDPMITRKILMISSASVYGKMLTFNLW